MRVVKHIPIHLIKVDKLPINPTTLSLIDFIKSGGVIKPISVFIDPSGGYKIKDGRHRWLAYKLLGLQTIEAKFSTKIQW